MKRIDLTGQTFGKISVIDFSHINKNSKAYWNCVCECGVKKSMAGDILRKQKTKSCGCERKYNGTKKIEGKFGKLNIIEFSHYENGYSFWKCKCDCGNQGVFNGRYIRNGDTKSCGCLKSIRNIKHGKSDTPIYWIWNQMIRRCKDPEQKNYRRYGERGISVCERWNEFKNFYKDMGERPEGKSLDRIDNDGNYSPENCRWADVKTQANNTRKNIFIKYRGTFVRPSQIYERKNRSTITYEGFLNRLRMGWNVDVALTKPSLFKGVK